MELDNFRRQWQQQPVAATAATEDALRAMLAAPTNANPLHRLKKNASRELTLVVVVVALLIFDSLVLDRHLANLRLFTAGVLLILCGVGIIVYQRLQVIRQMERQQDNLYSFLQSRITKFRQLMRIHDYVGLGTLLVLTLVGLLARRTELLAYLQPANPDWGWHLGLVGGVGAAIAGAIYASFFIGKKEHQRRYGQYLDQLEAALRELQEPR